MLSAVPRADFFPDRRRRDYILLITILVAFLEATAQQLRPYQPPVVMGFSGVSQLRPFKPDPLIPTGTDP